MVRYGLGDSPPSRRLYNTFVEEDRKSSEKTQDTMVAAATAAEGKGEETPSTPKDGAIVAAVSVLNESAAAASDRSPDSSGEIAYNQLKALISDEEKKDDLDDDTGYMDKNQTGYSEFEKSDADAELKAGDNSGDSGKKASPIFGSGAPVHFEMKGNVESWEPAFGARASSKPLGLLAAASTEHKPVGLLAAPREGCGALVAASKDSQTFDALIAIAPKESQQFHTLIVAAAPELTEDSGKKSEEKCEVESNGNRPPVSHDEHTSKSNEDVQLTSATNDEKDEEKAKKCCAAWTKARRAKRAAYEESMEALNATGTDSNPGENIDDVSVAASTATTKQTNVSFQPAINDNRVREYSAGAAGFGKGATSRKPEPDTSSNDGVVANAKASVRTAPAFSFGGQRGAGFSFGTPDPSSFDSKESESTGFSFGDSTKAPTSEFSRAPALSSFGAKENESFGFSFGTSDAEPKAPAFASTTSNFTAPFSFTQTDINKAIGTAPVTSSRAFVPTDKQDGSTYITLQSITAMEHYTGVSFEELRLGDYLARKNGSDIKQPADGGFTSQPTQLTGGLFGAPTPAPTNGGSGGLFGAPTPAVGRLFGSSSTGSFGNSYKPAFLFGSQPAPPGTSNSAPSNGLFGASATSKYGARGAKGVFGAPRGLGPKAQTGVSSFSFAAPTQEYTAPKSGGTFGSPVRAPLFHFQAGTTAASDLTYKESMPTNTSSTASSGEIQALKERLKTARMFEKFAKSTFLRACEQSGASDNQENLDLEKAAKSGFLEACKEAEAAELSLNAALKKWGLDDAAEKGSDDSKKRSVSPVDEVDSRQFKRQRHW